MKQFLISLMTLISFTSMTLASEPSMEAQLKNLDLAGQVDFTMAQAKDHAEFKKLDDAKTNHIDLDLMSKNIRRLSPAFISADGAYVVTTGLDQATRKIKTILFMQIENQNHIFADDVVDVKPNEIQNLRGSFKVSN